MKYVLKSAFFGFFTLIFVSTESWAQTGTEDIAKNIVNSSQLLPGLISAFMYLAGIILVITGLIKIKDYVDNERQTSIRVGITRLIVGGMCFAMPTITNFVMNTINGGDLTGFSGSEDTLGSGAVSAVLAILAAGTSFNGILENIRIFSDDLPGIISALSYLLGLLLTASGILKLKEHIEEPEKVSVKEPITRLITAGALFALPYVFTAMYTTIAGSGLGAFDIATVLWTNTNFITSSYQEGFIAADCATAALGLGRSVGEVICFSMINSYSMIVFLQALAYMLGLILGLWGILKIRDHVLNPTQTKLSEGVTRLIAAGCFFGLPYVVLALQESFMPVTLAVLSLDGTSGYSGSTTCGLVNSLDQAFNCFVNDLLAPSQTVLNFFCYIAGIIFIMIGISRLTKSAQDGPRGPGGLGTVGTFVTGGVLLSGTQILSALSVSFFGRTEVATRGTLAFTAGMDAAEMNAAHNVVSAVIKFMIIVGLISFVRGIFILRDTAEGKSQASVMSGMTHIIGGALAVNLGPLINAIQMTLGIVGFGVTFI